MSVLVTVCLWLFCFIIRCDCGNPILFITDDSIEKYDGSVSNISHPISNQPLRFLNDIGYDYELQTVYYAFDFSLYSISMITQERKLLMTSNNEILGIAVDWVTKKIYFTLASRNRVAVINSSGKMMKVLFQRKMASLRAICVSPRNGYLFFSDMGDNARIERANMDGTDNKILVNRRIQMPTTLTVDPKEDILYWADILQETVEMVNMDGTGRKVLLRIPNSVWGAISSMAVFDSQVFMSTLGSTDRRMKSGIFTCTKTIDSVLSNCTMEITGNKFYSSVKVFGKEHQKKINSECRYKNGGCSHLCLLTPNQQKYTCDCPTGYTLLEDKKTCTNAFKKFIIFATHHDLRVVSLDVRNKVYLILPINILRTVRAVDYDPVEKMIYWTAISSEDYGVIMRASLNGSVVQEIVPEGYTLPDHLAIDWVARNLYWTCPTFHKIYVSCLNGSFSMVVIDSDLEEPRGIAVDPGDGRLYWSDWGTTNPKIESSNLDGSDRTILVNDSLRWPNGVALDYVRRHLYWVDAGTDHIEYYDLNTKQRHKLEYASPHPFGVSVLGDMLYWTDWQQRSLFQLDLVERKVEKIIYNLHDIMGTKAVDTSFKYGYNACGSNNFGCSHFCFHKPNEGAYCVCPKGYYLSVKNHKVCIAVAGYLLFTSSSSINMLSINPTEDSAIPKILDQSIAHITTLSKTRRVFWVQDSVGWPAAKAIKSASLNHTKSKEIVQTGFSSHVGGITVDWLSENIYWSQTELQRIEVSRADGRYKRTIVNNVGGKIGKVVVDPIKEKLYWIQSKDPMTHSLVRADLDGSSPLILTNFAEEPFGLTVDFNDSRIYWLTQKYIGSILWNGNGNRTMNVSMGEPKSMVLFKDHLFVCEIEKQHRTLTVSSVHKKTGEKNTIGHIQTDSCDISVFHSALQQGDNACSQGNGNCHHLCFPITLKTRKCECEAHYTLDTNDNTTCLAPKSFLLISEKNNAYRFLPSDETNVALNLKVIRPNIGMTCFNIMTGILYWLELNSGQIFYIFDNKVHTLDLCKTGAKPTSFTIDFLSNTLYWTDSLDDSISFVHLNNNASSQHSKCGVIFKHPNYYPTKILSMPETGQLFFVNDQSLASQKSTNPSNTLESIQMDGNEQKQLYNFKDVSKYDVAIDPQNKRVYWLHLTEMLIKSVSFKGTDAEEFFTFNTNEVKPLAITILGGNIYWIDKKQKHNPVEYLKWRSLKTEMKQIHSKEWEYESTRDLQAVEVDRADKNHPCNVNNGGCSHICFSDPMATSNYKCGCPKNYGFQNDSITQCEERNNSTCAFICNGVCKPLNVHCEELSSCPDQNCRGCTENEYKCLPGSCLIPFFKYCNGIQDCFNGLDESITDCRRYKGETSTTVSTTKEATHYVVENAKQGYSEYTAGIVSGAILTAFVFVCVFYVTCRLRQKKTAANAKNETVALREAAAFKVAAPHNKESVFVLTPNQTDDADSAFTDSYDSSNDLSHLPRQKSDSIPTFAMRYITGSSTNVTDSTVQLPFNPPPTIVSSDAVSLTSLDEFREPPDIAMSEISEMTMAFLPAPPATPLYCPSDIESVIMTDIGSSISRRSEQLCRHCAIQQQQHHHQNYRRNRSNTHSFYTDDTPSLDTVRTYTKSLERSIPPCSNCSYNSSSDSDYPPIGCHKPPASYHPPSLVSEDSTFYSRTLPRLSRQGGSRPLVPSLASGISRCTSESSMITVRHKDDQSACGIHTDSSSDYYSSYGPPPSPRTEFPPEMNNFEDFKDEEDEALENDLLLESHRPPPGSVD